MEEEQKIRDEVKGWYSRGYLPHFDAPGLIQHITFHLADSLPRDAVERMQYEIGQIQEKARISARRKRIQELLDSGLGSCVLRDTDCARIVQDSLLFGDGSRYRLLAWVIMPNHVHVLLEQFPGWPLSKVVQSWKRHTSREIRLLSESSGRARRPSTPLWQRDYWDRFIRNERHYSAARAYIENNPIIAGLTSVPYLWPWVLRPSKFEGHCPMIRHERHPAPMPDHGTMSLEFRRT
ncbi:MAG: type I restriction enzyme, R subunit/putative DNA methylase [Candidatus Kentron sp. G]|nr:MAG: type I restriction enzyme, R subunit/putative DNA methylase [Candidatus Kentron sp. G]VFN07705.1 MAG: type I restriction enzyme, R subunit/putative DNA methylase [Candidatus Kentron sp. G]